MNKKLYCSLLLSLFSLCVVTTLRAGNVVEKDGYSIKVYNFDQIEPLFHPSADNDTVYIFNFWATYCAPCIKELPYFEKVNEMYADKKVKVMLISLDFKSQIESRVIPFLKRKDIKSEVVVLSDPDANSWIDKVSPSWSGAIPATLVVKGEKREFYEKEFSYEELQSVINSFL